MEYKKLASAVLLILLVLIVAGVSASVQVVPDWQQVHSNGFGDPLAGEVSALEAFDGYLYAGTHNPINDARIFRSPDGLTWTPVIDPGFGEPHDIAPPAILDLALFNGQLFASTGRGNAGQIWNTLNGVIWAPVTVTGFSDPDNVDITAMAEYGGKIYAGVTNQVSGAQIWSSFTGANNSWTQVAPAVAGTIPASVTSFAVFDGGLHAAIEFESDTPAQIWRSYGGSIWETIVSDGFGDSNTALTGGMAVFAGYLYAGAGNTASGAQLWRSNDGESWVQAITPAFGDPNNEKVEMVYVFQNQLYVSVKNSVTGIEIWRSTDGALWERANQDGFGDGNNTSSNWSNATEDFLGQLYVGTSNVVDGGELWRMQQPFGVNLSPDQDKLGSAAQTVTYTLSITNTGTMADNFDLTATGQTWPSSLSTSLVSLTPSASEVFTVTVDIPPGTADQESDTVIVTATSQGDSGKSDSAALTTTTPVDMIAGRVLLQGRSDHSGANVCADDGGGEVCMQTGADGLYTLDVAAGSYLITVDMERYLDAEKLNVPVAAGSVTTLPDVTCLGGDSNDDCVINILDLALMGGRFGLICGDPNWDPRADINDDCTVNILDLAMSGGSFGKICPVPWA